MILGQIATIAGSLALVRVLTEYLSPSQYGELALGLTIAGLMSQVIFGGVSNGISRFYAIAVETQDLNGYLADARALLIYATLVAVLIGAILLVGLKAFGYSHWIGLAAAALALSLLSGYNAAIGGLQNAARQREIVALHSGLNAWLKIILAIAAMLWLGSTSVAVVIGYVATAFLVTMSQLVFLRRSIPAESVRSGHRHAWVGRIWSYSWPFATFGLFTWMQQVSDRWALEGFSTTLEVGHYAVLFQLGYSPIAIVTGVVVTFLGPIIFQRSGDARDAVRNEEVSRLSWNLTYLGLSFTIVGTVMAFAAHGAIFSVLVSDEYRDISYLLPWFVLAGGLFAAGQTLSLKLMAEMKTRSLASVKIITALIGILLNIAGAVLAGLDGVAAALVVFSASYFIGTALVANK